MMTTTWRHGSRSIISEKEVGMEEIKVSRVFLDSVVLTLSCQACGDELRDARLMTNIGPQVFHCPTCLKPFVADVEEVTAHIQYSRIIHENH